MSTHRPTQADHTSPGPVPPWQRPVEPEHPMMLEGAVIDGDTALMFRCLVEEYLMAGQSPGQILEMCMVENYQALYAARRVLGAGPAEAIIREAAQRVGQHRVRVWESGMQARSVTLTIGATANPLLDGTIDHA